MDINDVVIHINESLDSQERQDLEDQMRAIDGVIAPRFNEHATHLMIVAYDPGQLRASEVLGAVCRQGYHAQHCGA